MIVHRSVHVRGVEAVEDQSGAVPTATAAAVPIVAAALLEVVGRSAPAGRPASARATWANRSIPATMRPLTIACTNGSVTSVVFQRAAGSGSVYRRVSVMAQRFGPVCSNSTEPSGIKPAFCTPPASRIREVQVIDGGPGASSTASHAILSIPALEELVAV
eukprot:CAMPEP_0119092254 /NCGR_PEP_ID=MMETSP1178-20130426/159156_1 /TAXON_ID=33656 /ORGANISM="unid sp, Strain CCMP2000" /LENGTH=160 /DNA_ID=CAMNT_0007075815 /DNA_START=192 /DNA_END=674 /DNA_ORIENTATION=-